MPRKNIFQAERLLLEYSPHLQYFALNRWYSEEHKYKKGRRYHTTQGAYDLINTIKKERVKKKHDMEFKLKVFIIGQRARRRIEEYEQKIKTSKTQELEKIV